MHIKTNGTIPGFYQPKGLFAFFVFILFFLSPHLIAQNEVRQSGPDTSKIKLFMDCYDCDFAYFRRNLPFVNFVRDPKLSDVHLLVTERRTASNGREYGFNFIGSGNYSDLNYKLITISPQYDTNLDTWERLVKTTKMGLMPYVARTNEKDKVEFNYKFDSPVSFIDQSNYDRWNFWVFRLGFGSDLELEESQNEYSMHGYFRIDRITEMIKFRSDVSYYRNIENFEDGSETIESLREEIDSDIEIVYSLGPRWSAGLFTEIRSSTYQNTHFSNRTGPAIEYNIFPWDESDRRIFSLGYHLESNYFNYIEPTIYNETTEFRASESLRLSLILRQPWGEVEARLEGAHYFHDISLNRLTLDAELSVNVTKGLAIYVELDAGLIHDQLYLPAGEISREELLLRQRQLETDYEISLEFGISLTFGSIYNNIVNQRL
jgi:hypothetical protein